MNKKVEPFLLQALSKLKMRCLYVLIISIYRLLNIDDSVVATQIVSIVQQQSMQ